MTAFSREEAVERVERLLATVERERMPVPVREVWVYGDVALGLDPVERLDVYLTKDILLGGEAEQSADRASDDAGAASSDAPDRASGASHGVEGVGQSVRADWAEEYPEYLRANRAGHAAPEQCLAAHLLDDDEPVHLEVCNASFEDNVTQRLEGALARENYEHVLDPRGVCLWVDGRRSEDALEKLRAGEFVFPTLAGALEMLGADEAEAERAADVLESYRERQEGATVRGDVV